jgi:hypothetical protein
MKDRLIAGAIPLVVYPFVAMASLMSLASPATGTEPAALLTVARGFQLTSLFYPLVYLSALFAALAFKKKNESIAAKLAGVPLVFLILVISLFVAWMALDTF